MAAKEAVKRGPLLEALSRHSPLLWVLLQVWLEALSRASLRASAEARSKPATILASVLAMILATILASRHCSLFVAFPPGHRRRQ